MKSTARTTRPLFFFFYLLVSWASFSFVSGQEALMYDGGVYILQSHSDSDGANVDLPEGQFELKVDHGLEINDLYQFYFKFGNLISARAKLMPTSLNFFDIASTKMMPPPEIYQLEYDLKAILESATKLTIDSTTLTIIGDAGSMAFTIVTPIVTEEQSSSTNNKNQVSKETLRKKRLRRQKRQQANKDGNA